MRILHITYGIVTKRVIQLDRHKFKPHKAIRQQKDDKAVRQNGRFVARHYKWDSEHVEEQERASHLYFDGCEK